MEEFILANPSISWLILGAIFIVIEVITFSGIVFLYAGLGAITVGGIIILGVIDSQNFTVQIAFFLAVSALWAAILWTPLKKFKSRSSAGSYSNMVGDKAIIVDGDLEKNASGTAKWSGTIMTARISEEADIDKIEEGREVVIDKVDGTTLYVKPL